DAADERGEDGDRALRPGVEAHVEDLFGPGHGAEALDGDGAGMDGQVVEGHEAAVDVERSGGVVELRVAGEDEVADLDEARHKWKVEDAAAGDAERAAAAAGGGQTRHAAHRQFGVQLAAGEVGGLGLIGNIRVRAAAEVSEERAEARAGDLERGLE